MDHVAIMKKSLGFLPKILSGQKYIESRWYAAKRLPWGVITAGETVYFKNGGEPITVKAVVTTVVTYHNLTHTKVREIIAQYGNGIGLEEKELEGFSKSVADKKYCILIFLQKPRAVQPFNVNKTGFGMMSAWLTIEKIDSIRASTYKQDS